MATFSYGWEKLYQAVLTLTSARPRSERLIYALTYDLRNLKPEEHLPEDMREEYGAFMTLMSSGNGRETGFKATVEAMDEAQITQAYQQLVSFFDRVARARRV